MKTIFAISLILVLVGCNAGQETTTVERVKSIARSSAKIGYRNAKIGLTEKQMLIELEKTLITRSK